MAQSVQSFYVHLSARFKVSFGNRRAAKKIVHRPWSRANACVKLRRISAAIVMPTLRRADTQSWKPFPPFNAVTAVTISPSATPPLVYDEERQIRSSKETLERLARLGTQLLKTPTSLISLIEPQFRPGDRRRPPVSSAGWEGSAGRSD